MLTRALLPSYTAHRLVCAVMYWPVQEWAVHPELSLQVPQLPCASLCTAVEASCAAVLEDLQQLGADDTGYRPNCSITVPPGHPFEGQPVFQRGPLTLLSGSLHGQPVSITADQCSTAASMGGSLSSECRAPNVQVSMSAEFRIPVSGCGPQCPLIIYTVE
jgi:hypothetical protein